MTEHDEALKIATSILELRVARAAHLPGELFGESAWDLLLILFIADGTGERITAEEACKRCGGPASVTSRWLKALQQRDLVACPTVCDDGHLIALTPGGVHAVEACMLDARSRMAGSPPVRHHV